MGRPDRSGLRTPILFDRAAANRHVYLYNGALPAPLVTGGYNAERPVADDPTPYPFATFGYRDGWYGFTPRLPRDVVSLAEHSTEGFYPKVDVTEWDGEIVLGLRGHVKGWGWNISGSYASDRSTEVARDTLKPSLGPTSPTQFLAQKPVIHKPSPQLRFGVPMTSDWGAPWTWD